MRPYVKETDLIHIKKDKREETYYDNPTMDTPSEVGNVSIMVFPHLINHFNGEYQHKVTVESWVRNYTAL